MKKVVVKWYIKESEICERIRISARRILQIF